MISTTITFSDLPSRLLLIHMKRLSGKLGTHKYMFISQQEMTIEISPVGIAQKLFSCSDNFLDHGYINTLRPRQNGRNFPDNIFEWIFLTENVWILIKISLTFVPQAPISNIPALVQIMAWRRPGDKPLSEPMLVSLLTHICVTRPQWVNTQRTQWNDVHFAVDIIKCVISK